MHHNMESLMNDIIFKESFANKHNRKALEFLLELFLGLDKGSLSGKLKVQYESYLEKSHIREKSSRGDIVIEYENMTINLEAYTRFDDSSLNKSMYYVMKIYVGFLQVGDFYKDIGKVIQINFVDNATMTLGDEAITSFYLTSEHDPSVKLIPDKFCIKIVQIDKIRELGYNENDLIKWLRFIAAKDYEERKVIAEGDELLMEFNEWINKYVNDEETKELLAKWSDYIAENKGYEEGKEEGIEEGRIEGRAEGIEEGSKQKAYEIAKKLLYLNIALEDISKATGLSEEEIEELREEN